MVLTAPLSSSATRRFTSVAQAASVLVYRLVAEKEHGGKIFALIAHGTLRLMS
jgi:hypothetical protein